MSRALAVFLIDIDFRAPGHDYGPLWRALEDGNAQSMMNASWLVDVSQDIRQLTAAILSHCAAGDGLFVVELAPETRWSGTSLNDEAKAWLKSRMTSAKPTTPAAPKPRLN